jgi:hypothetical protein
MKSKILKRLSKKQVVCRGRRPSGDARRPSHIPLNMLERERLHKSASSMGMPYATWARMTLLIVSDWPLECQPIRLGSTVQVDRSPIVRAAQEEVRQISMDDIVPGFGSEK